MTDNVCVTIKVAMADVQRRLNTLPSIAERLVLNQQMNDLESLWNINGCGGGVPWEGLPIDPPTQDQIDRVTELMDNVGETTVSAMQADAVTAAVIKVVEAAGGSTAA